MQEDKIKIYIIFLITSLFFSYLFFVLFNLQIKGAVNFKSLREQQNSNFSNNTKRGTIYGMRKDGELIPLAIDEIAYKLIISPKDIPASYESRLYELLNGIVTLDKSIFLSKISNKKDAYEEIIYLDKNQAEQIGQLDLPGVFTDKLYKRQYPQASVGARVIGFVGNGENGFEGKYGLEKFYEKDLRGQDGLKESFFSKIFKEENKNLSQKNSQDIVTNLEPNVMYFLNSTLANMKNEWGADIVSAIVIKPDSGEIIAMETLPSYDPNNYANEEIENFSNPSINGVYELGSIMKPITISSAINENLISPNTVFHDKGYVKVDEYTIKNFDERVRGDVTMQEVISQSLNTGAVYAQQLLGKERFKKYFDKFGFADFTNVDFPNEVANLVDNLDTNTNVNYATASFGQGVAVTPLGMLSALSVIVNDGKKMCPHFLKYRLYSDNFKANYECDKFANEDEKRVISEESAVTTKKMLIELIESGLAKGKFKDENYLVGAKTGTAQIASPDGKYYKDKFVHSYFTFFPGDKPEYAVLIYQVNPKKGSLASLTLAPYASKIKNFILGYYTVTPDRQ